VDLLWQVCKGLEITSRSTIGEQTNLVLTEKKSKSTYWVHVCIPSQTETYTWCRELELLETNQCIRSPSLFQCISLVVHLVIFVGFHVCVCAPR
jgi:hypothetical protein